MGTNLNFKGSANEPPGDPGGSGRPLGNFFLSRQPSVYSLTFDEFQNNLGKDFGSMNMDELLKSIWSAEENQNMASAATATGSSVNGVVSGQELGNLQRQGSLTLPRTLSTMTVDEVWKDISKEYGVSGKDVGTGSDMPSNQRQLTLGEITLEEFLVRAGVVREDTQMPEKPNNNNNNGGGFLGDLVRSSNNNVAAAINFQQPNHGVGLMGGQVLDNNNQISLQSPNLPLNVNGVRSSGQQSMAAQLPQQPTQQPLHQQSPHHPTIYPKQATVAYPPPPMAIPSSAHLGSPRIRGGMMGLTDPTTNGGMAHGSALQGGGMGLVGMGGGATGVASGSPANLSSDGLSKSNGDTASVSPVPYMFSGGLRGRKSNNAVEKVIERRQRRMIKNRESAARSRARKQAYTMELEQEVAKLKEENQELRKKQAEIMEMQKNQALEMLNEQPGAKKRCLRRTQTGPW